MSPTFQVADLFCGAGGSSTGAALAVSSLNGTMNLVAVNHWNTAINTHSQNHPEARHILADVQTADPEDAVPTGMLDLLMASPECTYHSRARGGKPIPDQGRMNPWIIINWLTRLQVKNVLIENVPEFTAWGPLDGKGKPIPSEKGKYFAAWHQAFINLGYSAEWKVLNAADYGEATSRRRFFMIARADNRRIRWPEPTHSRQPDPMQPLLPWRGAREIIDWSLPGRSLLTDPKYVKKPLALNTRKRIAKGLAKYGGPLANHYITLLDLPEPAKAGCASAAAEPQPFILNRIGEPAPTATGRGSGYLVNPVKEPVAGKPAIIEYYGQSHAVSTETPLRSITAQGRKHALISPLITLYYGKSDAAGCNEPLPTVTTKARHALVQPELTEKMPSEPDPRRIIEVNGTTYLLDLRFRMLNNAELSKAMGFSSGNTEYRFAGTVSEVTKQIGNAVPVRMAAALVKAILQRVD